MIATLMIGRMKYGSRAERLSIQPTHGAWRSSTDSDSIQYSARKIGIWISSGKQPAAGLTFSFLYNSIVAICSFWRSSP